VSVMLTSLHPSNKRKTVSHPIVGRRNTTVPLAKARRELPACAVAVMAISARI
jgi:hypothetical protein